MSDNRIVLKPGKETPIKNRHHWIFSGAIQHYPKGMDGSLLPVYSSTHEHLGTAYLNSQANLMARMICFDQSPPYDAMRRHLEEAIALRQTLFSKDTNAYRIVNGEADFLPGLIVDQYDRLLVMQISSLGMDHLREWVIEQLKELLSPVAIYEKSIGSLRKPEKLPEVEKMHFGSLFKELEVLENGLRFMVSFMDGQKTGFFLDLRHLRQKVRQQVCGKRVLNCCAYSGAFSVYALAGGARHVTSLDISPQAVEMAKRNIVLNGYSLDSNSFVTADLFQYLRENPLDYDYVILDPPAFAKKKEDITAACRGYKDINRLAMQKMPKNSLLLTCSCSYHVNKTLFQQLLFQAAVEAGRKVRILEMQQQVEDHPINICHPESNYFKSFLLHIL